MSVLWSSELLVCVELTTEVQCRKLLYISVCTAAVRPNHTLVKFVAA
jgi:hypothetical protein